MDSGIDECDRSDVDEDARVVEASASISQVSTFGVEIDPLDVWKIS
jgi:hypothetical protein